MDGGEFTERGQLPQAVPEEDEGAHVYGSGGVSLSTVAAWWAAQMVCHCIIALFLQIHGVLERCLP